jgi:hypothetical protein
MRQRHEAMAARAVEVDVVKVPGGGENPADLLTRSVAGSPWLHEGATWAWRFEVECRCESICNHVVGRMREVLQVLGEHVAGSSRLTTAGGAVVQGVPITSGDEVERGATRRVRPRKPRWAA